MCQAEPVLVGAADIFANEDFLVITSSEGIDEVTEPGDDEPAADGGDHVSVRTYGKEGLVRVTIWEGAMPLIGEIVFEGTLDLTEGELCIGDPEMSTRLLMRVGEAGPQNIVICADDPGYASRVSIGFEVSSTEVRLTEVAGHPLAPILVADGTELTGDQEFGLILDGHDTPLARLAAALKLLPVPEADGPLDPNGWKIVEWLRRLGPMVTFEDAEKTVEDMVAELRVALVPGDDTFLSVADGALGRLTLR